MSLRLFVLGKFYKSLSALCRAYGVPRGRVNNRIRKLGIPLLDITDEQWKVILDKELRPDPQAIEVKIGDFLFKSLKDVSWTLRLNHKTFKSRIYATGKPVDQITDDEWLVILGFESSRANIVDSADRSLSFWRSLADDNNPLPPNFYGCEYKGYWYPDTGQLSLHTGKKRSTCDALLMKLGISLAEMSEKQLQHLIEFDGRKVKASIPLNGKQYQNSLDLAADVGINHSTLLSRFSARGLSVYAITEPELKEILADYL